MGKVNVVLNKRREESEAVGVGRGIVSLALICCPLLLVRVRFTDIKAIKYHLGLQVQGVSPTLIFISQPVHS
jgi:hypothetical protein